jgi:hypothetical protein
LSFFFLCFFELALLFLLSTLFFFLSLALRFFFCLSFGFFYRLDASLNLTGVGFGLHYDVGIGLNDG